MTASEIIKKVRAENNLTQKQLADLVDTTKTTVSKWESGERGPHFNTIIRVLEGLNYHIEIVDDYREDRSKRTLKDIEFNIWSRDR